MVLKSLREALNCPPLCRETLNISDSVISSSPIQQIGSFWNGGFCIFGYPNQTFRFLSHLVHWIAHAIIFWIAYAKRYLKIGTWAHRIVCPNLIPSVKTVYFNKLNGVSWSLFCSMTTRYKWQGSQRRNRSNVHKWLHVHPT